MQSLSPSPTSLNPLRPATLAHRHFYITRYGSVWSPARPDRQSTCSIISSSSSSHNHTNDHHNHNHNHHRNKSKSKSKSSPVNGNPTLDIDIVPISSVVLQKSNLPKPLTTDLSPTPMHGSTLRVAYQGVPGAYSEAAAGKAYPGCDEIPCDQFEVAFQAVELWIADRAVLPVENSLGGSIHRNYDLLLRHRLHIVGEVQLPVHHCLLALPGVRKEYLTRVISHPQALSQCEHTLTELGLSITREAVDDTAAAAEFIAVHGLRDTAAIASARAAQLYGLQVSSWVCEGWYPNSTPPDDVVSFTLIHSK